MRIALFSGNYNYLREGANQALNRLVRYCEGQAGHEVRVYSPVTSTPAFEPAGRLIPVASVKLPFRGEFQLALGLPRATRRDLDRFRPDVIHVATPDILCTRAQTFAYRKGVPIVASLHTHFETYLEYYRLGWARPIVEPHLRRFYRRSDHVLAPTPALVTEMRRLRGDDQASLWARGVDRQQFRPDRRDMQWRRAQGIMDDEVAILFFGRLVLEKGVAAFVDLVSTLRQRRFRIRPLLVGDGPARAMFDRLEGVVAPGYLQGRDLAIAVASADIMLTPSTTETFGNVVLEAMASGLPVVSADAPSARALLEDGSTGYLCPARNMGHYLEVLEALIRSPEKRATVGAAALRASEAFSWDRESARVERVYRKLCDSRANTLHRSEELAWESRPRCHAD